MLLSLNDNSMITWRLQFSCVLLSGKEITESVLQWKSPFINGIGSSLDKASVYQIHSKWTNHIFTAS